MHAAFTSLYTEKLHVHFFILLDDLKLNSKGKVFFLIVYKIKKKEKNDGPKSRKKET